MTCRYWPHAFKFIYQQSRSVSYISRSYNARYSPFFNVSTVPSHATATKLPVSSCSFHSSPLSLNGEHSDHERHKAPMPVLMKNHTEIIWPSVFKSIGNMIAASLIVTPYFDNDFKLSEFVQGAKQALIVIANSLAMGDVDSVEGLVEKEALDEIRHNISRYSLAQLSELAVYNPEEIYLNFPYKLGIIMNDKDNGTQERFVEITMCYHLLRGLPDLIKSGELRPGPASMKKYQDRITICNYRFIREFTKGVEGQWIVNMVHHFRLTDAD